MITEQDIPFVLNLCDAYAQAVVKGNPGPLKRFGKDREKIEAVYDNFFFKIQELYCQKKIPLEKFNELFEELRKDAADAFVEGDAKVLEKFEKKLSKHADFKLMNKR